MDRSLERAVSPRTRTFGGRHTRYRASPAPDAISARRSRRGPMARPAAAWSPGCARLILRHSPMPRRAAFLGGLSAFRHNPARYAAAAGVLLPSRESDWTAGQHPSGGADRTDRSAWLRDLGSESVMGAAGQCTRESTWRVGWGAGGVRGVVLALALGLVSNSRTALDVVVRFSDCGDLDGSRGARLAERLATGVGSAPGSVGARDRGLSVRAGPGARQARSHCARRWPGRCDSHRISRRHYYAGGRRGRAGDAGRAARWRGKSELRHRRRGRFTIPVASRVEAFGCGRSHARPPRSFGRRLRRARELPRAGTLGWA